MTMVKHFSELTVWQRADDLAHRVFDLTDAFPKRYLFTVAQYELIESGYEEVLKMLNGLTRSLRRLVV